jgi:hypothetical protein
LRGVHNGRACQARILVVIVPELKKLSPWYWLTTDLELGVIETVLAYAGRPPYGTSSNANSTGEKSLCQN